MATHALSAGGRGWGGGESDVTKIPANSGRDLTNSATAKVHPDSNAQNT